MQFNRILTQKPSIDIYCDRAERKNRGARDLALDTFRNDLVSHFGPCLDSARRRRFLDKWPPIKALNKVKTSYLCA